MLKRLARAASLASALCLFTLAAAPARAQVGWGMPDNDCYELSRSEVDDMLFKRSGVTQEAVITEQPAPALTDEARRNGTRGVVRLGVALSKDGKVMAVWVFNRLPDGLTERAVAAACRIRFSPAQKGGRPVTSRITLDYHFNPDSQDAGRARPAPEVELPPAPDLPPAVALPPDEGMGVGPGTIPSGGYGSGAGTGYGPRNPSGEEKPFSVSEVSRKAVIRSKPEPGFTREARENATFGLVRLRAALWKDGAVRNISVVKGLADGLTEKAIIAARGIRFRPAQKDGRDVSQWVTLEYNFNLDGEDGLKRKAVILEQPAPEYTAEARRRGVTGKVVLDVALWSDGVVGARVVEGLPHGLSEKAVEAARKIKFTPAEAKGEKVSVVRRVEYRFPPE